MKKRRRVRALDWGNLVAGLKTALVGGGVAAKVAATVAVVGATAFAVTEPLQHQRQPAPAVPKTHAAAPVAHPSATVTASVRSARRVAHRQSVAQSSAVRAARKLTERAGSPSAAAPGQVSHASGVPVQQGKSSLATAHVAKPAVTKHAKHARVVVHSRPQHIPPVKPVPVQGANAHSSSQGQGKN